MIPIFTDFICVYPHHQCHLCSILDINSGLARFSKIRTEHFPLIIRENFMRTRQKFCSMWQNNFRMPEKKRRMPEKYCRMP